MWEEASQPSQASEGRIPTQEAGVTIQKGIGEGRQTRPSWHIQKQEEGLEEVAVHMCLYVTVLLCLIKMLVKQGVFVFMRIDTSRTF